MKIFNGSLNKIILIGVNDYSLIVSDFCLKNKLELIQISSKRMNQVTSVNPILNGKKIISVLKDNNHKILVWEKINISWFKKNYKSDQDIVFSFDSPFIIKKELLNITKFIINEHGAFLPKGRGGGGFSWRILEDDRKGNVLFHLVDEGIDSGEIIFEKKFIFPKKCIKPKDYMIFQYEKTAKYLNLLLKKLHGNNNFNLKKQNERNSEYFPRLNTIDDSFINWDWHGSFIIRFINAFSDPYAGARTYINKKLLILKSAKFVSSKEHTHPFKYGIIFRHLESKIYILCNGGYIILNEYIFDNTIIPGDRAYTPNSHIEKSYAKRVIYTPEGLKDD